MPLTIPLLYQDSFCIGLTRRDVPRIQEGHQRVSTTGVMPRHSVSEGTNEFNGEVKSMLYCIIGVQV
jgi:hypothetical protein